MGSYPTVVDWNNDGYHDLLVGDSAGGVSIFLNTNDNTSPVLDSGTFIQVSEVNIDVGGRATPVVDDWDGDGRKDLLIGDWDGNIEIFLNSGTDAAPEFSSSYFLEVGEGIFNVGSRAAPRIYDWNNDGLKDILVGVYLGNIYYLENVGTNSAPVFDIEEKFLLDDGSELLYPDESGTPRVRFDIADWNGDGLPDILAGGKDGQIMVYVAAPEPFSSTLFLVGSCVLGLRGLRKKRKATKR